MARARWAGLAMVLGAACVSPAWTAPLSIPADAIFNPLVRGCNIPESFRVLLVKYYQETKDKPIGNVTLEKVGKAESDLGISNVDVTTRGDGKSIYLRFNSITWRGLPVVAVRYDAENDSSYFYMKFDTTKAQVASALEDDLDGGKGLAEVVSGALFDLVDAEDGKPAIRCGYFGAPVWERAANRPKKDAMVVPTAGGVILEPNSGAPSWSASVAPDVSSASMSLPRTAGGNQTLYRFACSAAKEGIVSVELPSNKEPLKGGQAGPVTLSTDKGQLTADAVAWINHDADSYVWRADIKLGDLQGIASGAKWMKASGFEFDYEIRLSLFNSALSLFNKSCSSLKKAIEGPKVFPVSVAPNPIPTPQIRPKDLALEPPVSSPPLERTGPNDSAQIRDQRVTTLDSNPPLMPASGPAALPAPKKPTEEVIAALIAPAPAIATIEFCNRSSKSVWAFIATPVQPDGKKWRVEGWFEAKPTKCVEVSAAKGLVHWYAHSDTRRWDGRDGYYCVPSRITDKLVSPKEKCIAGERKYGAREMYIENDRELISLKP